MSNKYIVVLEIPNGRLTPSLVRAYRIGEYADAVRATHSRSDGAASIEADEDAADFVSAASACRVIILYRSDAANWFDPENERLMAAFEAAGFADYEWFYPSGDDGERVKQWFLL